MKKTAVNLLFPAFVGLVMALSIWGPEALAGYKDGSILNKVYSENVETGGEGYRYTLNSNERIYILSQCLNSQNLPESEQNAFTRTDASDMEYQELEGTYAFVVNHKGPSGKEITDAQIYETCNREIEALKELGILPESVKKTDAASYTAVLYSAIDVLEPRNNVAVWKLSLSTGKNNANKENRLIDAYIDADSGKIYEFYARTAAVWEDIDTDEIMDKWTGYMGLRSSRPYESENPLLETTPYFKKYVFDGMNGDKTIATVGFYEGINEIFLKISK